MALTQSAAPFPGGPSWDNEVVPALRKRLEGESRILSKRISLIEDAADQSPRSSADRTRTQPAPRINGGGAPSSSKQRARTYSQPKLSEIPNSKPRSPDPSPRAQYQTRIPKAARGRTGSITTNNNNYANGYTSPQQRSDSPADMRRLNDAAKLLAKQPSQDTIHIPLRQTSGLLNEPAPFGLLASAGPSSTTSHEVDEAPPRPSNDSEERPFEHWYRGEVSRNGGVGELKLGKRAEMLEIANYGHTLKQKQALREAEASNQRRRKRSESTAGIEGQRGSLYLDEEENGYGGHGRVLDEGPLTDVDNVDVYEDVYGDGYADGDAEEMSDGDYYHQQYQYGAHDTSTASAPLPARSTPTPTQTPSRQHGTRIPSPRAVTPTPAPPLQRGQSEPPSLPASGSLSQAGRQLQTPNAKRGATSPPPASSSSASKRPRAAATPKAKPKPKPKVTPKRDDKDRRSVAYYPSPGEDDGEDLADAIPTWTQPVKPQTGRWDDVVLPVVARKKGLDDHYEKADGSPKPKKEDRPVEPAAGTFGWDHSKYRPPRGMDEFGRPVPMDDEGMGTGMSPEEEERMAFGHRPLYPPTAHEQQPVGPRPPGPPATQQQQQQRPRSPPPFTDVVVNMDLDAAQAKYGAGKQQGQQEEDDGGAGCCKCVVM